MTRQDALGVKKNRHEARPRRRGDQAHQRDRGTRSSPCSRRSPDIAGKHRHHRCPAHPDARSPPTCATGAAPTTCSPSRATSRLMLDDIRLWFHPRRTHRPAPTGLCPVRPAEPIKGKLPTAHGRREQPLHLGLQRTQRLPRFPGVGQVIPIWRRTVAVKSAKRRVSETSVDSYWGVTSHDPALRRSPQRCSRINRGHWTIEGSPAPTSSMTASLGTRTAAVSAPGTVPRT